MRTTLLVVFLLGCSAVSSAELQVCCRPLPKWYGSKNVMLWSLNRTVVSHLHHCFIDFGQDESHPFLARTSGIHPIRAGNHDKQPIPDQDTDVVIRGGKCKRVIDATAEKVTKLQQELEERKCNSCAGNYHNRVLTWCFNNSNTYVYDLISGAGMTPPHMWGAPGYRAHHNCGKPGKLDSGDL